MKKIKITKYPVRSLIRKNGILLTENVEMPYIDSDTFSIENPTLFLGEPFDFFKYKVSKNGIESVNEGRVAINFETEKDGMPPLQNVVKDVNLNSSFYFSDVIPPDIHYDRINISWISGNGQWLYKGVPLMVEQQFFYYDLIDNLVFNANDPGVMNDYASLKWFTANKDFEHPQENTLTINSLFVATKAELTLSYSDTSDPSGVIYNYLFGITKGLANASYVLSVDCGGFPEYLTGLENNFSFVERSNIYGEIENVQNSTITSALNSEGETVYSLTLIKSSSTVTDRNLKIKLESINNDPLNVNTLLDEIILIIPPSFPGDIQ